MKSLALTSAQRSQLQVLDALGANSSERAKAATKSNGLNGVMLGVALVPAGLVGKRIQPAQYGEPKRTLYWITPEGVVALDAAMLALPSRSPSKGAAMTVQWATPEGYDPVADAAEQVP